MFCTIKKKKYIKDIHLVDSRIALTSVEYPLLDAVLSAVPELPRFDLVLWTLFLPEHEHHNTLQQTMIRSAEGHLHNHLKTQGSLDIASSCPASDSDEIHLYYVTHMKFIFIITRNQECRSLPCFMGFRKWFRRRKKTATTFTRVIFIIFRNWESKSLIRPCLFVLCKRTRSLNVRVINHVFGFFKYIKKKLYGINGTKHLKFF